MATRYKRGKKWYVAFCLNGKRVYKSLDTTDESLAKKLQKEYEVKLNKGLIENTQQKSIESYRTEYVRDINGRKNSTNKNQLYTVDDFLKSVGKKTVNGITVGDVRAYLADYEKSPPRTFNNVLSAIKSFFRYAVAERYILRNPCEGIKKKRVPKSPPRFFTDDEYLRIEKVAEGHRIFPMIVTARYTGLRLQELIHLEWQDFDWTKDMVSVLNKPQFNHTIKNYQGRVVPLSYELRDKLLSFIPKPATGLCFPSPTGQKYSEQGPKRTLKAILKKAGITRKRAGWHEFRHTFASRLVQNSVSLYKVSKWLGHSSMAVTEIYSHLAPSYDKDIEKLTIKDNGEKAEDLKAIHRAQAEAARV